MKRFPSAVARGGPRSRRRLAALVGYSLIPGLLTPVVFAAPIAMADGAGPLGRPKVAAPESIDVKPFQEHADKAHAKVFRESAEAKRKEMARAWEHQARTVTWPTAGTATVSLPATGSAKTAPGSLPLTLAQSGKKTAARSLTISVLDQKKAAQLGVKGVVLTATAPVNAPGTARLAVDYRAFAAAYGGDWAGRLRLQRLPDCALTTPTAAACRTRTPLPTSTHQRAAERLTADLTFTASASRTASATAPGRTMVLALAAGPSSGGGDFKATALSASSTWEAGGSSGTFGWSYPLEVPDPAAGPQPDLSVSYDSGAVDGRTANTNNQGSLIGEGFDITSSYIERKYATCDDDGQTDKFDLCWKYENATLVLNGRATELVKDDTDGKWRLKNDDATTVTLATGADNRDDNGEHWIVTTGDGTKYTFGKNVLPGAPAGDTTDSVWTVPVFGDDAGEPGYDQGTTFSGRDLKQAWRWNLDLVEDTRDNAMTYWYTPETNYYDTLGNDSNGTSYHRGGYLNEIRYGQRVGALFSGAPAASHKVVFSYAERCTVGDCASLTEATRNNWPDVPFDAECKSGQKCTGNVGPSFYTRKRMTGVATQAWDAAATPATYASVDSWAFTQVYLDPGDTGDSTDQSLWLDRIQHTGKRGTDITANPIVFGHQSKPNRVDGKIDDILPLTKPRLRTITTETGGQTRIDYQPADCSATKPKPKLDTNTGNCFPVYWAPNGGKTPILDWFQKYPVASVMTGGTNGGVEWIEHKYTYPKGGAWRYNEDPLTKEKERTWSLWRGFGEVVHTVGQPGRTQSKTVTVHLRGMHGDRVLGADGKLDPTARKSVSVSGIKAGAITDSEQYAGFVRESVTYNGAQEVRGTINDPWSLRTAVQKKSYADTEAHFVRTGASHARVNVTSSGTARDRVRSTVTTYDEYGMPKTVLDRGDNDSLGDESCTRTWYARGNGFTSLVSRTRVVGNVEPPVADPCALANEQLDLPLDAGRPGSVISDTAVRYDSTADWSLSQVPTRGDARWAGRAQGYTAASGAPVWQTTSTTSYDALGRPLTVKDNQNTTTATTVYTPALTGPLTETEVTNAKGYTSTTLYDFASGVTNQVTDPNRKVTSSEYDSLGRVQKVWLPDRSKSLGKTPNHVFTYSVSNTSKPSWVASASLNGTAEVYNTTYQLYDSLLRSRQTQSPTPVGGTVIDETLYDERGLAVTQNSDIWSQSRTPGSELVATDGGQAPLQVDTVYDGAERSLKADTKVKGVTRWSVETGYLGDTVTTTAPAGGQAVAVVSNARDQLTERREYAGPKPTGSSTTTRYTYTPAGKQASVRGPDGATWSYGHDLFGRQISAKDPDKGTETTAYNDLDQAVSVSDARATTLHTEYDVLGRRTGLWSGSKTNANKQAAWTYDALAKGQSDTAVRYVGGVTGQAYTQKVTSYDSLYQATGQQLQLPADEPLVEAGVPQTLSFGTEYNVDGTIDGTRHPAVAGLKAENVRHSYNGLGGHIASTGTTGYLQSALYSPLGELNELVLGTSGTGKKARFSYDYETGTGRLKRSSVHDDLHSGMRQELLYTQDPAGNVTSIFDTATEGGTVKPDYQCFGYDGHRRLTDLWTPKTPDCSTPVADAVIDGPAPYRTRYTYNAAGQRASQTNYRTTSPSTTTYTYGTAAKQPHTLLRADVDSTGAIRNYSYDAAGNTTGRPGPQEQQTLTWNPEGRLATLKEPASGTKAAKGTSYLYDASGSLLIRRPTTADGDTVLYLGSDEVRLTVKGTTKTLTGTRYYSAAGKTVAVRTAKAGATESELNFLAGDHHGTSTLSLDATTYAAIKRHLTPFGAPRGTTPDNWPDDKGFLGKTADTTTGLTHISAREYDPALGQFISVDPLLETDRHQSLNGYAYGHNSPVTNPDPSGMGVPECHSGVHDKCNNGAWTKNSGYHPHRDPQGCVKNCGVPGSKAVDTWGWSNESHGYDYNGDGLVSLLPTVDVSVKWKKLPDIADAYAKALTERKLCRNKDYLSCFADRADQQFMRNTAQSVLHIACMDATGSACPGGYKIGKAIAAAMAAAFDTGGGRGLVQGVGRGPGKGLKNGGCTQCFLAGTDVLMADGRTKDIEDVKLGDMVLATDPETGESGPREVTRLIVTDDDRHFNELTIETRDGPKKLTATHEHPFWSPSADRWVEAKELKVGMTLLTDEGETLEVQGNRAYEEWARTYNLTVNSLHTYYVLAGRTPVLVHNSNGECGTSLTRGEKVAAAKGVDQLSPGLRKNLTRFMKGSSGNAEIPQIIHLPGGGAEFSFKSAGKVPGSYAIYRKRVNSEGVTELSYKTTFLPDGSIAHIKFK
ncbi:polymorphic toxin-type HINT domain-containing protein [Streptomyces sp. NPDC057638]|uniref:polymorphic toxin-type HINT domain-containing protein n=1 Tax=Streptomyces sp. NPDC057638 TaxID=3346190 RepID=UPI0036956C3A